MFLLLLCVTGILLNHSSALGLDARYVTTELLLDRYGIESPEAGPSYAVGGRRVTLVGTRLYLDDRPVVAEAADLVGALELDGQIVAATASELLILDPDGRIIERWPVALETGAATAAIAVGGRGIAIRSASGVHRFDWDSTRVEPVAESSDTFAWAEATAPGAELIAAMQRDYRGRGVSLERLLRDVHSGRFAGIPGAVVMDLAALAMIVLAISGFMLWWRR